MRHHCNEKPYESWTLIIKAMCAGGCISMLLRSVYGYLSSLVTKTGDNSKYVLLTLATLLTFHLIGHLATIAGIDRTCKDPFNVKITMMQWIEWQITVPLIFYIMITLDSQKQALVLIDYSIIGFATLCIFFPFISNFGYSLHAASILLVLSCVSMVIAFILLLWQSKAGYDASVTGTKLVENLSYSDMFIMNIAQRKYNCSILMCFMFQLFPLIYFLDYVHIVNSDYKHAALICLSYFAKSFFCTFIVDFHMDLMDPNTHIVNYEKRANESRRAYLRYVFHEVRVPLNSISMGLHVLQGSNLSSSEKETIVMMREATLFMTATLNDVLSIQKIEQGKLELVKSTTSLTGLFSRVKSSLKGLVVSNEITVETVIGPNTPKVVLIDPHRIEHVIANLVSNACKFSPKGSTITLDARKVDGNDNMLMISVTDQGIGMSPEDMTKLFIPFSQIRAHELQEGRGSGVGLAICKEVVELHGGKISVKSKLKTETSTDHGSTFYFTITYEDSNEDCQDDSEEDGVQKTLNAVDEAEAIEKWKILVVDDVRSNRKILSLLLNKRGISNDQAENGVEALEMIEKFKYDLVITDQIMPKMNGIVLAAELRKRKYPNIIVGLTGNALDEEIVDFIEAGVDIVMTKPLKYAQLEKLIQFMLKYGTESVQKDIRIEEKSGIKSEKLLSLRQVN